MNLRRTRPTRSGWAAAAALALALATALQPALASAATTDAPVSICTSNGTGNYQTESVGGDYQIQPDEWNSSQALCMSSDGGADFTVASSALTTAGETAVPGAPGAYTRIQANPADFAQPTPVATMGDTLTSWSTSTPTAGEYDVAYDIWYADDAAGCSANTPEYELMIWLNSYGGATPAGSALGSASIDGKAYTVSGHTASSSTGSPSGHYLINYRRTATTDSVYDLNLRTITADAVQRGYVPAAGDLCSVQAGFEIWSGGAGLATDSFSYQPSNGLPSGNLTSGVPGKCLDAGDNAPTPGAATMPADIWSCASSAGQTWTVGNDDTIRAEGLCLDATGTANGTHVDLSTCAGTTAQAWVEQGAGIENPASGLCLADPSASATNGTAMILWTCGASGQDWRYPYDGQPIWTALTNHTTLTCLSAGVAGADSVDLRACASPVTAAQNWELEASDIVRSGAGQCLDAGTSGANGSLLQAAACDGAASQQWLLSPDGSLVNPATDKCADDPLSTTVTGTPLDLYTCNGTGAQEWYSAA